MAQPVPASAGSFDEQLLVERARRGDDNGDAFAALYRHHLDTVHAFCWRRTGRRDLAEDITAATFERALRSLSSFHWRGPNSFRNWLLRLASNQAADLLRSEGRDRSPKGRAAAVRLVVEPAAAPDGGVDRLDVDGPRLRAALGKINPRYEQAVMLRHVAQLDPADVAEALGVARSTSAVLCHRALRALRKAYEEVN